MILQTASIGRRACIALVGVMGEVTIYTLTHSGVCPPLNNHV
jgi:hypothetical protein